MKSSFFKNKSAHYLAINHFEDFRGSSTKFFQQDSSIPICQALMSFTSQKMTLRGLHTQMGKMAEEKIIYCISGELIWFAINFSDYKTTREVVPSELRLKAGQAIYVPKHHLNGMISLTDNVRLLIVASRPFDKTSGINVSPFDCLFFGKELDSYDINKERFDAKSSMITQAKFLETLISFSE